MKYFCDDGGRDVEVELERWGWKVWYEDGSTLSQFGEDGRFRRFDEIERKRVATFAMIKTDGSGLAFEIAVTPEMRIFHRYVVQILDAGTPQERRVRIYLFGWNVDGAAANFYIVPNDTVVTSNCLVKF